MQQGNNMSPVHFLVLLSRQSVANPPRITSRAGKMQEKSSTSSKTGADGVDFLGRVVTSEWIERERSIEREKRRPVGKFGGDRKSDQDLESGLVIFDEAKREKQSLCFVSMRRSNPKQWFNPCLHKCPHMQQSSSINISPV
jgi:hypothetical protein